MYLREIILSYYMGFKCKNARVLLHNRRQNLRVVYNSFQPFFTNIAEI